MGRNSYRNNVGKGFKTVVCSQTGEEVTRRQSLAIGYKGDGKGGSPAAASPRVKRELAPEKVVLSYVEEKIKPKEKKKPVNIIREVVNASPASAKERVQMKKLLDKKRNEDPKPTQD